MMRSTTRGPVSGRVQALRIFLASPLAVCSIVTTCTRHQPCLR
jgi:hypothetical protein